MALRLQTKVEPGAGARWLRDGWRVFLRRPLPFCGLFVTFIIVAVILLVVPVAGPLLLLGCMPLLTLSFMLATHETLAGRGPGPSLLWRPLQGPPQRRRSLLALGALYAVTTAAILWLSSVVDGGTFTELQIQMGAPERDNARIDALLEDPRLSSGLLLRFGLAALVSIPFWHAPALVYWGGQGVAQALFSSTLAVLRCTTAFAVYMVGWAAMVTGFSLVSGLLLGLLGLQSLLGLIAMPAGLVFSTVFYASLYFTFRDSFTDTDGDAVLPPT